MEYDFLYSFDVMSIISTFDPKLEKQLLEKAQQEFWIEKVVYIKKSKLFLFYMVILPFLFVICLLWWLSALIISFFGLYSLLCQILLCIIVCMFFIVIFYLYRYFLVYKMDFILVSPTTFVKNKQFWFFKRDLEIVEIHHIKSVNVKKKGLFQSLFDVWSLIIYSDWIEKKSNAQGTRFRYVRHPEIYCNKIEKLLCA